MNVHREKARNPHAKMVAPTLRQEELQYVLICPVNMPSLAPLAPPSLPGQGQTRQGGAVVRTRISSATSR